MSVAQPVPQHSAALGVADESTHQLGAFLAASQEGTCRVGVSAQRRDEGVDSLPGARQSLGRFAR